MPEKAKRKQFVGLLTLRYFCVSDSLLVGDLPPSKMTHPGGT